MSFANPVWDALRTTHRHFAINSGEAYRYPAEVAPFAAVETASQSAMRDVATLLTPGEAVWLVGDEYPEVPELILDGTLDCLQMVLPGEVMPPAAADIGIVPLTAANAKEMVALTDVAFPGFFRRRTCEMGAYFGVRLNGELIAMGGERLLMDGYAEISGLCAHPAQRGKGLATSLIWELVRMHRRNGVTSFLHVGCANTNAIRLYRELGFQEAGRVVLTRHVAA
jgi:ribosomal protein S18 acetylase RimI-like enzyme